MLPVLLKVIRSKSRYSRLDRVAYKYSILTGKTIPTIFCAKFCPQKRKLKIFLGTHNSVWLTLVKSTTIFV